MPKFVRCRHVVTAAAGFMAITVLSGCVTGGGTQEAVDVIAEENKASVAFKVAVAEGLPKNSPPIDSALSASALTAVTRVAAELDYFSEVLSEPGSSSQADMVLDINHYKYGTKDVTVISGYSQGVALCVVPTRDGQYQALQFKSASAEGASHDAANTIGWSQLPVIDVNSEITFENQIKAALIHLQSEGMLAASDR